MAILVARQYVDVLGPGEGKVRVARQYVDVLGLVDVQEASKAEVLSFVETINVEKVIPTYSASDALSFIETAAAFACIPATDALALVEVFGVEAVFERPIAEALSFIETIDLRGPIYIEAQDVLHFSEVPAGDLAVIYVSASDVLEFEDRCGRVLTASASDVLVLTAVGERRNRAADALVFVETLSAGKGGFVEETFHLTQVAHCQTILNLPVNESLGLVESGTYQLVGPGCLLRFYKPMVGFSSDATITPPTTIIPTLGTALLTLTYPYVTPTLTVVLRNPEFGNKDNLTFTRVNRQTRGGTLVVFADAFWPKVQLLHIEIRCLKSQQVEDLLNFFTQSLGKEVGLLDHENRQWHGIITDPDAAVSNPGRGDYSVTFEFEGELA